VALIRVIVLARARTAERSATPTPANVKPCEVSPDKLVLWSHCRTPAWCQAAFGDGDGGIVESPQSVNVAHATPTSCDSAE
jgi:hypothetical protein